MNRPLNANEASCLIEIGCDSLRARQADRFLAMPLERSVDGRLTFACKGRITAELQKFIHKPLWQAHSTALCAVGARGVSIRRLQIPAINGHERQRLLALQIESEYPLPPRELAWGFVPLKRRPGTAVPPNHEEFLVAAVKKDTLEDYAEILNGCGVIPIFTPAALARGLLCSPVSGISALVELGQDSTELLTMEDGVPSGLRVLPWGLAKDLPHVGVDGAALDTATQGLAAMLRGQNGIRQVWLSGSSTLPKEIAPILRRCLGAPCELLSLAQEPDGSAAIAGLSKVVDTRTQVVPLNIDASAGRGSVRLGRPAPAKWAAIAGVLILLAALFPYAEALVMKPFLARKLAAIKADRGRLPLIDSELEFLRFLKQNQPSYLDALYLVSKAAPPGTRFDAFSLNRRGDVSLRGSMRDATQVAEFRSKLLDSGIFSSIAVDDQTPTPDRQKLVVRMTAQWKPTTAREVGAAAAAKEPERPKSPEGGVPGGDFPGAFPGLPPGVVVPSGASPGVPPGVLMPTQARGAGPVPIQVEGGPPISGTPARPNVPVAPGSVTIRVQNGSPVTTPPPPTPAP